MFKQVLCRVLPVSFCYFGFVKTKENFKEFGASQEDDVAASPKELNKQISQLLFFTTDKKFPGMALEITPARWKNGSHNISYAHKLALGVSDYGFDC